MNFTQEKYFVRLKEGSMSKEEFISSQYQFYHAVVHFTIPLALTAAAIPTYEERVNVIKNIWEEHGEGNSSLTHGATFGLFMERLTGTAFQVKAPQAAVLNFNQTLTETSKIASYWVSVAMLGQIEHMFADISSFIGNAVIERGWMKKENMVHYSMHEELDCIHAEDFFSILRPLNAHQKEIDQGLQLGRETFLNLYRGLNEA